MALETLTKSEQVDAKLNREGKPECEFADAKPISFEHLFKLLSSSKRVLTLAGQPIDGDSLSSAIALRRVLKKLSIKTDIACGAHIPAVLSFLKDSDQVIFEPQFDMYDVVISLDCGEFRQTGFVDKLSLRLKRPGHGYLINIDHHIQEPIYGHYSVIDTEAASTGVIIHRLLTRWQNLKTEQSLIDEPTARAILTSLYSDTGSFQHSNTNTEALRIAADCVRHGANASDIAARLYRNKSVKVLQLWGRVLKRLKLQAGTDMVVSYITQQDLKELDIQPDEAKGIVNVISYIPQSKFALLLSEEEPNVIKGSLRSDEHKGTDVARIAKLMGGGGHRLASGFKLEGHLEEKGGKLHIV